MSEEGIKDLIPSVSIPAFLAQRDALQDALTKVWAIVDEAEVIAKNAGFGSLVEAFKKADPYARHRGFDDNRLRTDAARWIDASAWQRLLDMSGLRSFLDATAVAQWHDSIEKLTTPDLTADNIEATFASLYGSRHDMMERGIIAMFRHLSWDYKTNTPARFGKRLIVRGITHDRGKYPNHGGCSSLDDLVRALAYAAGEPEPDHRRKHYVLLWQECDQGRDRLTERVLTFPYFTLRLYENSNGHVTFTRPELVDKLNAILHKHYPNALPPSRNGR